FEFVGGRSAVQLMSSTRIFPALLLCVFVCGFTAAAHAKWHLRTLTPAPGSSPFLVDSAGNLFAALGSGVRGGGAISEVVRKPDTNKYNLRNVYNFCALNGCTDGSYPSAATLVMDASGNLYGTTQYGGSANGGTFYKLVPNKNGKNWVLTVLYNFCSKNSACTD